MYNQDSTHCFYSHCYADIIFVKVLWVEVNVLSFWLCILFCFWRSFTCTCIPQSNFALISQKPGPNPLLAFIIIVFLWFEFSSDLCWYKKCLHVILYFVVSHELIFRNVFSFSNGPCFIFYLKNLNEYVLHFLLGDLTLRGHHHCFNCAFLIVYHIMLINFTWQTWPCSIHYFL